MFGSIISIVGKPYCFHRTNLLYYITDHLNYKTSLSLAPGFGDFLLRHAVAIKSQPALTH